MPRNKLTADTVRRREAFNLIRLRLIGSPANDQPEVRLAKAIIEQALSDWICGKGAVQREAGIYIKYQRGFRFWWDYADICPQYTCELLARCGYSIRNLHPNSSLNSEGRYAAAG